MTENMPTPDPMLADDQMPPLNSNEILFSPTVAPQTSRVLVQQQGAPAAIQYPQNHHLTVPIQIVNHPMPLQAVAPLQVVTLQPLVVADPMAPFIPVGDTDPNFSTGMNAINSPGDTTLDPNFSNGMNANNSGDTAILDPNLSTGINSINSGDTTIDPNLGSGINSINSGEDANAIETDRIGHTNSTATRADEPTIAGPQFERIEEAQQPLPEQQMAGRRPRKDFGHRLKEVQAFKTKHGHCMIPHKYKPNPSLGTWVDTQRRRYRKTIDAKKKGIDVTKRGGGFMSEDHIQQLMDVGFVFEPRLSRKDTWSKRLQELQRFKEKHGHCNVREDDTSNPGLGKWVSYVRRTYRLSKQKQNAEGNKKLSKDRISQLNRMGFIFELKEEMAMKRFRDGLSGLKNFFEKEGHLAVPSFYVDNPTFGLCVEDMRIEFRKICNKIEVGGDGYSDTMNAEIVQELANMGFLAEEGISPYPRNEE